MFFDVKTALTGKSLKYAHSFLTDSGFTKVCDLVNGVDAGFVQYTRGGRCVTLDFDCGKRITEVSTERLF